MSELSVVIPTRDRPELLARALDVLVAQTARDLDVVVVDGGSARETEAALARLTGPGAGRVELLHAPGVGVSEARNLGAARARGRYLAFLDDDAISGEDWVAGVLRYLDRLDPPPHVLGGPIVPYYVTDKPPWFEDDFELRTWGRRPRLLAPGESFSASNMVVRRDVLDCVGGFDVRLGPRPGAFSLGEETDLFDRLWANYPAARLVYSPRLVVRHLVPAQKMTARYQLRRAFASGRAWQALKQREPAAKRLASAVGTGATTLALVARAVRRRRDCPHRKTWLVRCGSPVAVNLGVLAELVALGRGERRGRGP